MAAINACLQETIKDMGIMNDTDYNYITILTDSMFCVYLMDERYYCKIQYYYELLQNIFKQCKGPLFYDVIKKRVVTPEFPKIYMMIL